MTTAQQIRFWLILLLVAGILLYLLRDILLPFVLGMGVAYLADPLADRLERWGLSRAAATTVITALFFALVLVVIILVAPLIVGQVLSLVERLPEYVERLTAFAIALMERMRGFLPTDFDPETLKSGRSVLSEYTKTALGWLASIVGGIWSGGLALLNLVSLLLITPIVAFYLLWEWDAIVARVDSWIPPRHASHVRAILREIDSVLSGFVRGQGTVCAILGLYYAVALTLTGLEFGFLIGLASGALSFIPYVGAIFGGVSSIGVALVQFWPDYIMIGLVAVIYIAGQAVEGNFLTPRLVGGRVRLHPVWVIFGLLAGGVLFGFVGLLLAVPVAAVIGVLVRFGVARYLQSHFYLDPPDDTGGREDAKEGRAGPS